ncbi:MULTISPECIES: threonine/serine exporter family protein [unclassified Microbacterium]|uniref:threonine/serine exporter family protein n=1 Tax=unclassified Microbacterium TaxID=2609290 RepID=UPI0036530D9A
MDPEAPSGGSSGMAPMQPGAAAALAELGALLLDADLSVTDVRTGLVAVADATGSERFSVSVLPAAVLIGQDDRGGSAVIGTATGDALSTRQAARSMLLLRGIEDRSVPVRDAPAAIRAIRDSTMPHPALAWIGGSAMVSIGLAVLFRCPWWAIATAAAGGAAVGALVRLMGRLSRTAAVIPFTAAFASTLFVGAIASWLGTGPVPLYAVCAPIAILVPGALITNALLELTAADIVTGSARLAYGLIVLGFMAAGIAAGGALTGLHVDPDSASLVGQPASAPALAAGWMAAPPLWLAWIGVAVLAAGVGLALGAGVALTTVGLVVMLGTYGGLSLLTPLTGSAVATGTTAAALFIAARLLERLSVGIPAATTFQPAFLLLVPGSVGLVALSTGEADAVTGALLAFAALCIGTKIGSFLTDLRLPDRTRRAAT